MAGFFSNLFGLSLDNNKKQSSNTSSSQEGKSFTPPENDGSIIVQTNGHYGVYVDLDGTSQNDIDLINRYRDMACTAEIDTAIQHILDDSLVSENNGKTVSLNLDDIKNKGTKKKAIQEEFDNVLRLLNFNKNGYDIFRRWYIDGRLYYHVVVDEKNMKDGIKEVRYIDPRRIKKIREIKKTKDPKSGIDIIMSEREYYLYNERGIIGAYSNLGAKINKDAVVYVHSGLFDSRKNQVLSHLHKAIKPLNNLRMIEDATVIYRISRAPERRVFYIDVGSMPVQKQDQYLKAQQSRFRNKIAYDATTGEIKDEKKFLSMTEDFWLPRREGGKGTEITTLPGGQNLGQIEDVQYFLDKMYKSLNIPYSRIANPAGGFSLGKSAEITRDEIAFSKFIQRLRRRFSELFVELLRRQLLLKGIVTEDEWDEYVEQIWFDFLSDNNHEEFRDAELLRERVLTLQQMDPFVGRYYSMEWVRKNVLMQTEEEIKEIMDQIEQEKADGTFVDPMEQQMAMAQQQGQDQQPLLPPPMDDDQAANLNVGGNPEAQEKQRKSKFIYDESSMQPYKE